MDYISHGLWSYIFFHRLKKPVIAVLFGLVPDTFSWGVYLLYKFFSGMNLGKPNLAEIPAWVFTLYGISHSLFIAFLAVLVAFFVFKRRAIYALAWPIAIIMDIPTHSREFLPTPFLWPFSDWHFPGFSWGQLWFMIVNYCLILVSLFIIYLKKRNKSV